MQRSQDPAPKEKKLPDIKGIVEFVIFLYGQISRHHIKLIHLLKLLRAINSRYFFRESLIGSLVFFRNFRHLKATSFIRYDKILDFYDASESREVAMKHKKEENRPIIPYKEEIDFIANPDSIIKIDGDITDYVMPAYLQKLTDANLATFLKKKPTTFDDPLVRIKEYSRLQGNRYLCKVQKSTYFMQARTNLTIDLPLEGQGELTLRKTEMGNTNSLKPFVDSILTNSVGVCGVVYYTKMSGKNNKSARGISTSKKYFFMKLRKAEEGVYEKMLGTVSGVGTYIEDQKFSDLTAYATEQMIIEFTRETGLGREAILFIKPLSFCRELARGGKPQFFFVIQIKSELTKTKEFKRRFQTSAEGTLEFFDEMFTNRAFLFSALSPEFTTNLIYAFQYFQSASGKMSDQVIIR
jgi:hypothetical protein